MMNLKTDWEKNKGNTKTLFSINFTWTIVIYLVLCIGTTLFLSVPLGIIFTVISLISLAFYCGYWNKLKKFIKEKADEKLSE